MIDIKLTINGKPATPSNIRNAIEKATYEAIKKQIAAKLRNIGPSLNGERLQVELKGTSIKDLSIVLSGPEDLVEKAKKILNAK